MRLLVREIKGLLGQMLFDKYYDPDSKKDIYIVLGYRFAFKSGYQRLQSLMGKYDRRIDRLTKYAESNLDIRSLKPATGELRRIQRECLDILKIINEESIKNGWKYWLDFGTLLGAVRHGGFIPWDTDIDISMQREDFEECGDILRKRFLNTKYVVRFAGFSNHFQLRVCDSKNIVGVDIFPVDSCQTSMRREELNLLVKQARKKLETKYPKIKGEIEYDIQKIRRNIHDELKEVLPNEGGGLEYLFYGIDYGHDHKNIVFEKSDILPLRMIQFEGEGFPCPNKCDTVLTKLYGNYMSFPRDYTIMSRLIK